GRHLRGPGEAELAGRTQEAAKERRWALTVGGAAAPSSAALGRELLTRVLRIEQLRGEAESRHETGPLTERQRCLAEVFSKVGMCYGLRHNRARDPDFP